MDSDTLSCEIAVSDWTPVRGAGRIIGFAAVAASIGGVVIHIQGWIITREARRIHVRPPQYRHADGRWIPAFVPPDELMDAINAELLPLAQEEVSRRAAGRPPKPIN